VPTLVPTASFPWLSVSAAAADELLFDERVAVVNREKGVGLVALDDALSSLSEIDPELG